MKSRAFTSALVAAQGLKHDHSNKHFKMTEYMMAYRLGFLRDDLWEVQYRENWAEHWLEGIDEE